ncbi:MFS transporter [Sulfuracidifex metallicus]|uniref:MFS transporter n=1 Tax=Sulfuracidifex metallicus DSM 6482 = JCM 9184 TaxID=523847 RepID=A0A6A9QPV9_SULME|nr:MFS transporter [Sulfuracidifex metallicus]MUN29788.1 MFS transporter [Sulfuracidifex metallicus DSM 6482 = JCM 9184]WOE51830.1 MFS transporter [Sulfuracidifex metallicus DSM 6482 = JCM 9184]
MPKLFPYLFLLFTIGFGWFIIAPLVPILSADFYVSIASVILLISIYGYAVVLVGLLAGYISARFTVRNVLIASSIFTFLGLTLRLFFLHNFFLFLIMQTLAAVGYPLAIAPVGSVASSFKNQRTVTGLSVGILFIGMGVGSFISPLLLTFGVQGDLGFATVLSLISLALVLVFTRGYPKNYTRNLRGSFSPLMVRNWYVGLVIATFSVFFGGVASTLLNVHHVPNAVSFGGLLGGLSFVGSGLGAAVLLPIFEIKKFVKGGMILSAFLAFVFAIVISYSLLFAPENFVLIVSYFLYGFFGNAFWSLALSSVIKYVKDPTLSGFATSMYSVVSNLGVALIPSELTLVFLSFPLEGFLVISVMQLVALALAWWL